MYIRIENISRGINESSNPLQTRTIGHCTIAGVKKIGQAYVYEKSKGIPLALWLECQALRFDLFQIYWIHSFFGTSVHEIKHDLC